MKQPICRTPNCKRVCQRYKKGYAGPPAINWSASCRACNEKHAKWQKARRAKMKERAESLAQ